MTGRLDVDPEALWQAGASLGRLAEQLGTDLSQLRATVTGYGNPWGSDEPGTLFGQLYSVVLDKAVEALDSYVEQVGYGGVSLIRQAEAEVGTDTDSASRIQAIVPPGGPP
jgi:hypothetical protein